MRRQVAAVLACLVALMSACYPAEAGQTRYDPKTKSFAINYTYARLPSADAIMRDPQAIFQVGESQESSVTQAEDDEVRSFLAAVNKILFAATRGLAVISRLEHVQDIEKADFVIALDVESSRGGIATPLAGSGEGRPGRFNLYYDNLAKGAKVPGGRDAIALTVAHELCHYFFGLPDEYLQSGSPIPRCPTNPGLGCLMDNYQPGGRSQPQGGWLGHLCSPQEHQQLIPELGYPTAPLVGSCQEIISAFFKARKNTGDPDFDSLPENPTLTSVPGNPSVLNAARQQVAQLAAATPFLKGQVANLRKRRPGGLTADDWTALKDDARRVLLSVAGGAKLSGPDLAQAGEIALGLALGKPPRLAAIEGIVVDEIKGIRASLGQPQTQLAIEDILNRLIPKLKARKELGGSEAAPADIAFSTEERAYLKTAIAGTASGTLADSTSTIGGRKPVIGGGQRRQTAIYTPMPTSPMAEGYPVDLVKTQGDPLARYGKISLDGSDFFKKLLEHNDKTDRIVIRQVFGEGALDGGMNVKSRREAQAVKGDPLDVAITALKGATEAERDAKLKELKKLAEKDSDSIAKRQQELGDVLDAIIREVEARRLASIVLLVPPGGLPAGFEQKLQPLADEFANNTDVRLDIALVGTAKIPPGLRTLSGRWGGTIQTITGVDEIGAAFQRLSNVETQGSWTAIPEQGKFTIKSTDGAPAFDPLGFIKAVPALYDRYDAIRAMPNHAVIDPTVPADAKPDAKVRRVAFKPFYCDGRAEVELIVGLSQPLLIEGVSPEPVMNFKAIEPALAIGRLNSEEGYKQFETLRKDIEENDKGFDGLAQGQDVKLDSETSTPSYLVFRMPSLADGGIAPGWYAPVLELSADHLKARDVQGVLQPRKFTDNSVNYTFSVGKPNTNTKVFASLVQTDQNAPGATDRGTIRDGRVAVVQAEVNCGLPVQGAQVTAYVQRIDDDGTSPIRTIRLPMLDGGQAPDVRAGDGIYSMTIPLGQDRAKGAEYRVFVEALTTAESRFIPMESIPDPNATGKAEATKLLPMFQRATSLNFRVAGSQARLD